MTGEAYHFTYAAQTLLSPFDGTSYGTITEMQTAGQTGLPVSNGFQYNSSAEMTQLTTSLGGILQWAYRSFTYNSGITLREVQYLYQTAMAGGTTYSYSNVHGDPTDAIAGFHQNSAITDATAVAYKYWYSDFMISGQPLVLTGGYAEGSTAGLCCGGTMLDNSIPWAQDAAGNAYISAIGTELDNYTYGSATYRTVDMYGNVTQQVANDYPGGAPARTYNYSFLGGSSYTGFYIRNRMTGASVTDSSGTITLATNSYDGTPIGALQDQAGLALHDSYYSTSITNRGNLTNSSGMGSNTSYAYQISGKPYKIQDGDGAQLNVAPSSSTNYSLPLSLSPNGTSTLATSFTYDSAFRVAGVTGPNGTATGYTYDDQGRPHTYTNPSGAVTTYTYTFAPNTQTATIANAAMGTTQWTKTTLDGFGRVISVSTGHDSTTLSTADTTYAAAGCMPLGMTYSVSNPYAPGGTPVYSYSYYDPRGRITSSVKPDGSTTSWTYAGPSTTVTDPAGKTKTYLQSAFGNLLSVTEPNPAGGTFVTNYSYNPAGQLTNVSMTRPLGLDGNADAELHVDGVGPAHGDEPGEWNGDLHVRRQSPCDEPDGCEGAGYELHVRYVRAADDGAALRERDGVDEPAGELFLRLDSVGGERVHVGECAWETDGGAVRGCALWVEL